MEVLYNFAVTPISGVAQNVALDNFEFIMYDTSGNPATGLSVVTELSLDGAAFGATSNTAVEVGSGVYKITLIQTEMNYNVITFKATAVGCKQTTISFITS